MVIQRFTVTSRAKFYLIAIVCFSFIVIHVTIFQSSSGNYLKLPQSVINGGPKNASKNSSNKSFSSTKCSAIFSVGRVSKSMSEDVKSIVEYIKEKKENHSEFLRMEAYNILAEGIPSMITTVQNDDGISKQKEWPFERLEGQFPHLPCRLRKYTSHLLKQCVHNRSKHRKRTHIFLMGDSRMRQIAEVLVDVFRDLDFTIQTQEGFKLKLDQFLGESANRLWTKYKKRFIATSPLVPNFTLEFHWSTRFGVTSKTLNLKEPTYNPYAEVEDIKFDAEDSVITTPKSASQSPKSTDLSLITESIAGVTPNELRITKDVNSGAETSTTSNSKNSVSTNSKVEFEPYPFVENATDTLVNITNLGEDERPSLMILGNSAWVLDNYDNFFRVLDEISLEQNKLLASILQDLARKVELVWIMPEPLKDYLYVYPIINHILTNLNNSKLEWVIAAQLHLMQSLNVTFWDSFYPMAQASINDCYHSPGNHSLPPHPALRLTRPWKCSDRLHTNHGATVIAMQMILNHLCNEFLQHDGYCCEDP